MTVKLQSLRTQYLDSNGDPLGGGFLFFYSAGTTTKVTTYSDTALSVANTNPIVLDSAGRPSVEIFLAADDYKVVLAPSTDSDPPVAPVWTEDDYKINATSSFSGGINSSGETEHLINAQTSTSYTILDGDRSKLVTHSNASAIAVTLPQANSSTFAAGWYYETFNKGAGTVTITPTTSTINGLATLTLPTNSGCFIVSDGTNYQIKGLSTINPGVNAQTGTTYTVVAGDLNKLITTSNASAIAVTLPQANTTTFKSGWETTIANVGVGTVTITPTTSTINTAATYLLQTGRSVTIVSDGTNYQVHGEDNGKVLLSTQTASTSANINFDNTLITTTYKKYIIEGIDVVVATDGADLGFQGSEDNGSTIQADSGDYHTSGMTVVAGLLAYISTTTTVGLFSNLGLGNVTNESMNFQLEAYNPGGTALYKHFLYRVTSMNTAAVQWYSVGSISYRNSVNAINYIRLLASSGNITSGTFKLYGVR